MRTVAILIALAASLGSAQEPPRQVFRSGIDLVTVDAVVVDRDGKPVTDLTAADFIVTANKQQRRVRTAEFLPVTVSRPAVAAPVVEAEPIPTVTTNVGLPEARSFLIVVDVDQIEVGSGQGAMRSVSDFVASLGPNDLVGVVALPSGRPRTDLTKDREAVRHTLSQIVGASQERSTVLSIMSVGEAAAIDRGDRSVQSDWAAREPCAQPIHPDCSLTALQLAQKIMREQRRHSSNLFTTLAALAEIMKPLKGLKTIVLVSEGMVRDRDVTDDLRRFSEAAAAARVTLYSLVLDTPPTQAADAMTKPPDRRLDIEVKTNGMADAAIAGGGSVFLLSGTAGNAMKRIDSELTGYYLLSFESDAADASDKRKSLEVKVRRPNVTVRARTDFAIPSAVTARKGAAQPDLRGRLGELLRLPVPVSDVAIDLATFASPAAPDSPKRRVIIAAELPAGIKAAATGFEVVDDSGKVVSDSFEPNPSLSPGAGSTTYLAAVPLNPGRYQLKFGVVTADDRRGSVQHSLWVRATPQGPLRLGDIVIGNEGADGFSPITRVPDGAARLALRVEVQATDAAAFEGASVLLDIVRRGETAPFTSATMPFEDTPSPLRRVATAALTIGRLPAGEYILRLYVAGRVVVRAGHAAGDEAVAAGRRSMQLGELLGPYRVTAKLGEGGMGAVYRARDTQLGRDVALKVLPDSFSHDPDRVARFTREAQVLASLDHPNLATIYGLERVGTSQIIVMELVEGATLEARLAHGPLAIEDARHVGIQVADGLDAAHERGIVHRDLKPSNVILRPDGSVKVLDFGLAKTMPATSPGAAVPSVSPTVATGAATSAGVILGTAPYMSPEQSRGIAVDRRTDIWALGCLLYECLAGRRAFEGSTLSDTLAHILTSDPDWSLLPATTPAAMSALIRRCLRKDPRQRVQSAGDVRLALEEVDGNAGIPVVRTSSRAAWFVFAGAAVVFAGSLALFVSTTSARRGLVPPTAVRADVLFPDQAPLWFEEGNSLAMSRDGRMIAWVGGTGSARRLWVRPVDQLEAHALAGTEEASGPFFSPDGEWLGFFTPTALKKIRISGGTPQTLAPFNGRVRGAAWSEDGAIVFSGAEVPLQRISSTGDSAATITQLPALKAGARRWPVWLPGHQVVLHEIRTNSSSGQGRSIAAVDLASGSEKIVIEDAAQPAFLANGDLLFLRGDALFFVAFDAGTLSPRGEPRIVIPSVQLGANSLIGQYATGGGRLVYLPGQGTAGKSLNVVEWRGITGDPRLLISEPGTYRDLRFSPDGLRLAYSAWVPVNADATDLFVYDLQRDVKIRLAGSPTAEWRPVWTSDGRFIVFSDYANGIKRIRADGSGQPEPLTTAATNGGVQVPVSIAPDGKYLAYHEQGRNQPADIWILPMNPAGAPFRFFASPASDTLPVFSPDGRWIAYASDESGANELYIRPFPKADAQWRVSSSGTLDEHAWSRDGRRLFFRAGDGQHVMAAPISIAGGSLAIGRATSILTLQAENYPELGFWGGLALSPDDRGFALAKYASPIVGNRNRVVLMLDWMDAMQRTVTSSAPR